MELAVSGGSAIKVSETTFDREFSEALVHQVVTAYMAGARAGTKAQKNRSQVKGGGAKPWAQKGTGRARAGTISSPIFRSGGKTFAATPRDHSQKVNRKMYRGAMQSILSELVRQERFELVDEFTIDKPSTSDMVKKLDLDGFQKVLIVTESVDENVYLSTRNIPGVYTLDVANLDPVSLVAADKVIMTVAAVNKVQEWLG